MVSPYRVDRVGGMVMLVYGFIVSMMCQCASPCTYMTHTDTSRATHVCRVLVHLSLLLAGLTSLLVCNAIQFNPQSHNFSLQTCFGKAVW